MLYEVITNNDATWLHTFYDYDYWVQQGGHFVPYASATAMVRGKGFYTWESTVNVITSYSIHYTKLYDGGITATILWELTRHFMVWYFSTLSIINVVYGTFATAIIILLSLEAAAVILLLGAQVISEYERIDVSWHERKGLRT